ncbi:hypothetical protein, partial [Streptococcus pyogenes]|uniref:hypothetical protein n=1 Tax=Streptococcus pyogenes TaxID=1314 RepID=UPI000FF6E34B
MKTSFKQLFRFEFWQKFGKCLMVVTPVKKTAAAAEMNIILYVCFLSASTLRYMAKATPINVPVAP